MGFVDDQENGFAYLFFGLDEGLLDLLVDSTFGDSVTEPQQAVDVTQKIGSRWKAGYRKFCRDCH